MNNLAIHRETMREFDYNALDSDVSEFLQDKEIKIKQSASTVIYHYTQLGKYFKETQDVLSKNGYGCFAEWFTSLGFKKDNVYNLIGRYNLIVGNYDKRDLIETLPVSLTYEMAKKSADQEINEKVFSGEIVNLKEYRQLKKQKKEATQAEQLTGQLDIADIVEVTAIEVVEATQDTQITIDDIDTIYNIALDKIKEIEIRQGEYWSEACCIGDLKVSKESSILVAMYLNKEITLEQMYEVVKKYRLDIPVSYAENKEEYFKQLDTVSSSYKQYTENGQYAYDVVSVDLDYKTVIECEFEEDLKLRKEYSDGMKSEMIQRDNIILTVAYDDSGTENLVVYKDKKLVANYRFYYSESDKYKENDWQELENNIKQVFKLDNIDDEYINLLHKLKYRCDRENKEHLKINLDNNKKSAKFTYVEDDYTFLILNKGYINKGDTILIYQGLKEFGSCHLKDGIEFGQYNFDIEIDSNTDLKELLSNLNNTLYSNFKKKAKEENRRLYKAKQEQERKQREQYKSYSNSYNNSYSGLGSFSVANKDKDKCKRAYKALSKAFHPDLANGSTEMMQFVNQLKQEWNI